MIDGAAFAVESASLRKEITAVTMQIAAKEMRGIDKADFTQITEYD